jgi:acetate kinase
MAPAPASILTINGGSSSIKFAVYRAGTVPT